MTIESAHAAINIESPTYDEMALALSSAQSSLEVVGSTLSQLAALFRALKKDGCRNVELIELGHNVADQWAHDMDMQQAIAWEVVERARKALA